MHKANVAVIGASGFLGRRLLRTLADAETPAIAVVRGLTELVDDFGVHVVTNDPRSLADHRLETVINLAYPSGGPAYHLPRQNRELFETIDTLTQHASRLIHVSSQAVFGLALDRPIAVGSVRARRDSPYVELKIAAEHHAARHAARGVHVDIVRPGNIWGAASGAWGVPLVQRLVTGRAVGVRGLDGFSNATDVANVASYLVHLLKSSPTSGTRYHHLAEFADMRWSRWILPTAAKLGVEPVYAEPDVLRMPASLRGEFAASREGWTARRWYARLSQERVAGSLTRSALRRLPISALGRLKGPGLVSEKLPSVDRDEQTYLAIMSTQQIFSPSVDSSWNPPVSYEESLRRYLSWLAVGT